MNAKVIAYAIAIALILVAGSIDIVGVTMLAGGPVPAPEEVKPGFDQFSAPHLGIAHGIVVMAPGQSTCDGVAQILPGARTARTASPTNTLARCG